MRDDFCSPDTTLLVLRVRSVQVTDDVVIIRSGYMGWHAVAEGLGQDRIWRFSRQFWCCSPHLWCFSRHLWCFSRQIWRFSRQIWCFSCQIWCFSRQIWCFSRQFWCCSPHLWCFSRQIWRFSRQIWRFSRQIWRFSRQIWRFSRQIWRFSRQIWRYCQPTRWFSREMGSFLLGNFCSHVVIWLVTASTRWVLGSSVRETRFGWTLSMAANSALMWKPLWRRPENEHCLPLLNRLSKTSEDLNRANEAKPAIFLLSFSLPEWAGRSKRSIQEFNFVRSEFKKRFLGLDKAGGVYGLPTHADLMAEELDGRARRHHNSGQEV